LEEQVLEPIQDPIEMGMTMAEVISRLNATEHYPVLFEYAFGTNEITNETVAKALAQFVRSMVSYTSKYDQGRILVENRTADFPNFTQKENRGKKIFMTHDKVNCFGCHNTDVFITDNPRNNGLNPFNIDEGIYVHTQNELDRGKFKTPSLKNVALRGRFMHDGGLSSLREVIEHYNSGIQMNPNLDSHLIDISSGTPARMNLSNEEMEELEAFLNTLTDEPFLNDVKYSNPFK
jgi:cytochrome c peroxidase